MGAVQRRYSRHYYDVAMMAKWAYQDRCPCASREAQLLGEGDDSSCRIFPSARETPAGSPADMPLLAQVVKHKQTFYPSAWSRYDLAQRGSFHLVPLKDRMQAIERDYRNMGVVIFGEPPSLDDIMQTLDALEKEINK